MSNDLNKFDFTRGDRMRRAMKVAGMSVQGMAEYLGVGRETVSTWLNDKHAPSRPTLMMWAAMTGATLDWLETGAPMTAPPDTPEWWRAEDEYPEP